METHIFESAGVTLEFAAGYAVPTLEEWMVATKELGEYVPPVPPDEYKSRVESELLAEARRFGVIRGNVATLPDLYTAVATLQVWSGSISNPL